MAAELRRASAARAVPARPPRPQRRPDAPGASRDREHARAVRGRLWRACPGGDDLSRSLRIRCDRCAATVEVPEEILSMDDVEARLGRRTVAAATGLFVGIDDRLPEDWLHKPTE